MLENNLIIEMLGICKEYPGVKALNGVNLSLREGEVKALIGENGAGKSTLIKMLTGAETPTSGEIFVKNKHIIHMTPALSEELNIACVYQTMMMASHLTVAENIWLGNMPNLFGLINKRAIYKKTTKLLEKLGYSSVISPKDKVCDLSISQRGLVAIARAISRNAKVVIFDEPTAVLANKEVELLFDMIKILKKQHIAIIYISHRIDEIFRICDTVTVLRDGKHITDLEVKETTEKELIAKMVGRKISNAHYIKRNIGEEIFVAENLNNERLHDCSLTLCKGEIVGIYGLLGAGRTELLRAIFGADNIDSGRLSLCGRRADYNNPRDSIKAGISFIPEDRRNQGLSLQQSVRDNINLTVYKENSIVGIIKSSTESQVAKDFVKKLQIKTPDIYQKVKYLSGGNQQKCVLSKWLAMDSKIFLMDEPTSGIDIGAKEEIYSFINDLAINGRAVLCVSSYMPELMNICDRILVMSSGKIVTEVIRGEPDFTEEAMLTYSLQPA